MDGGSTPASYPTNSFNLQSAITTTIVYTPAVGATAFVAGSAASSLTVTLSSGEISVPVALTLTSTTPTTGYPGTLSAATVTTGTGGTATFTFTPSNHAPDVATVTATVGPAAPANAGPYTTGPAAPSSATFSYTAVASDGNDYSTASPATTNPPAVAIGTDAQFAKASILFALADTFGNPIALNTAGVTNYTITLTALSGGGFFDATAAGAHPAVISCSLTGGGFSGNWHSGASAVTPTTACASGAGVPAGKYALPFDYFQTGTYSTVGKVSVTLTGTFNSASFSGTGSTTNLVTSTFDGSSPQPAASATAPDTLALVPAGHTIKVTAIVSPLQQGVPVTLLLDHAASYETAVNAKDYGTGSSLPAVFTGGSQKITVSTDSTGTATATFTVDTVAGAHASFRSSVLAPTNGLGALNSLANSSLSAAAAITTNGSPAKFVVKTYYDNGVSAAAKNGATGATIFVNVKVADAYNNPSPNPSSGQIQITLAATGGTLSANTVYINSGQFDTFSGPGGAISWFMPTSTGSITLSATGVLNGVSTSNSATIGVVSPLPTISVTSPKPLAGVIYSRSTSVVFGGQANASLGYAATGGTAVTIIANGIGYKIDSNKWLSAITGSGNKVIWSLAASMTTGLHTAQFNATDSKGNTVLSASYTVLVDVSGPTITFTTLSGANLNANSPVVASIVDTLGDLNSTSVTATKNGTAIAASSITIAGTNNPGTSVTYTVNINGLGSGTWSVTLNAKDLAGNTATAATLKVHVTVPPNQSFTAPASGTGAPQQCTQQGSTGACVTWTNNLPTSQTVSVWFVWYNAKNQVVALGFQGATIAPGVSSASFSSQSLPSGAYTVQTFIVSSAGSGISISLPITVTL